MEPLHPFDEMKAYVGFTDADARALREMAAQVIPDLPAISDHFYDVVQRFDAPSKVLADPARVERLKATLQVWARELLEGPHDLAYYERRLRIGEVHVRVGLPQQYMFTAMNVMRGDIIATCRRATDGPTPEQLAALLKITDLELAIMLQTYGASAREREMRNLRDLLVGHLPLEAYLIDADGRVAVATELGQARARALSGAAATGQHWTAVVPPALLRGSSLEAFVVDALEHGAAGAVPRVDLELDGEAVSLSAGVIPIEHSVARALLHIDDLTDAIETEARARQNEALAHIGTMAARVAHEIRNPLAGMSGTMQVLVASLADDDRRRSVLAKVLEQIDRLNGMVGDLLQFSKPVTARCEDVSLRVVALRVASQVAAAGLGRSTVEGEGLGVADEDLLFPALLNLVQNAWQAGAAQVRVVVAPGVLSVYDDGPGIGAEQIARIFRPFYTTRTRGTGLGLPNSRRAIEAMGGSLTTIDSPLGGAGFTIRLRAP